MAFRNYTSLLKEVQKSNFLRLQCYALFLTTYIDWTLIPFVTKLEGTYLPVFVISFYMLVGALDGFLQPLFKHIKIYNIYLFAIFLDILQIFSYSIISQSIVLFTYVILSIFTIQGITFEISRIHTVDFMQDEAVALKDYLLIRSFVISASIVFGSLSAMVYDGVSKDIYVLLGYLSFLGIIGVLMQVRLYQKFKKRVFIQEVEIQKDKKNYLKNLEYRLLHVRRETVPLHVKRFKKIKRRELLFRS